MMPVFDGHNDALSRLWASCTTDPAGDFARDIGHVNVDACKAGGMQGGFFALFADEHRQPFDFTNFDPSVFGSGLPPKMDRGVALKAVIAQAGIAQALQRAGHLRICTSAIDLGKTFVGNPLACILHLEGADCIDPDLQVLDALYGLGLRSLGPVWSRPTIFAEGVPFASGSDGDTGAGLTDPGKRLIARCRDLGMIVDNSHLTMKGFWDVADLGLPLVATHSNATAECMVARNLTDDQLRAVAQTGGMAGLNFATVFLSDRAWKDGSANIDDCIRHLTHMIDIAGEDHVSLGSDFDGAPLPEGITSAADLPKLIAAMDAAGFGAQVIAKVTHENWLRLLAETLG